MQALWDLFIGAAFGSVVTFFAICIHLGREKKR